MTETTFDQQRIQRMELRIKELEADKRRLTDIVAAQPTAVRCPTCGDFVPTNHPVTRP